MKLLLFSRLFFIFTCTLSLSLSAGSWLHAQVASRNFTLTGKVTDERNQPMEGATILLEGTNIATITNQYGFYSVSRLKEGEYTVNCSYIGYKAITRKLTLKKHDHIDFKMEIDAEMQPEVAIVAQRKPTELVSVVTTKVDEKTLEENSGKALGEILKTISGLNSITTGPSISKPVIHGLHSNRILILNNGVRHEAQQWGMEHAPEIDPFLNNQITIIKGAASIRYGSDAIGGVILMQPAPLPTKEGSSVGDVYFTASDNYGLLCVSGNSETALSGKYKGLAYRLQGTLKKGGNCKTPGYYLKNTGFTESDFSATVAYTKDNFKLSAFYSDYNTWLGVFEGSHVGNVSELYEALRRTKPSEDPGFSYDIDRSKQRVHHSLLKAAATYQEDDFGKIELQYSKQENNRQEYDLDLPFSSDPTYLTRPQIDFHIYTDALNLTYAHPAAKSGFAGQIGIEGAQQTNICDGLRYLIPNFRGYSGGIFALERFIQKKYTIEAGVRYDYRTLKGYPLQSNGIKVYEAKHAYSNLTYTLGANLRFNKHFSTTCNLASAWRAPSVNELYIAGVHLSAASYELGDSTLKSERSNGITFTTKYESKKFNCEIGAYYQLIDNFIYSKPTQQVVSLISGAYPSFHYTQTKATLSGFDVDTDWEFAQNWKAESKLSIVYGINDSTKEWLVLMPADRLQSKITYNFTPKEGNDATDSYISLSHTIVAQQTRIPEVPLNHTASFGGNFLDALGGKSQSWEGAPRSDYTFPTAGYMLFDLSAGTTFVLTKQQPIKLVLTINNLLDTRYRDYLSRYRYFADDLGRTFSIHIHIPFK